MEPIETSLTSLDRLLFDGELVRMGQVVAKPHYPDFEDDGPVHHHAVQFHAKAIQIESERGNLLVDPHVVAFFEKGEACRRRAVDPEGECSFWIAFDLEVLPTDRQERLSHAKAAFVSRSTYLTQLVLGGILRKGETAEPLGVETVALELLDRVLSPAAQGMSARSGHGETRRRRDIEMAEAVRGLLVSRYDERHTLASIGRSVGSSPFHMARAFRRVTGRSVHGYLISLRLRKALYHLCDKAPDLARLAVDLGFYSHSHFTTQFKAAFGISPSSVRGHCERGEHHRLLAVAEALIRLDSP